MITAGARPALLVAVLILGLSAARDQVARQPLGQDPEVRIRVSRRELRVDYRTDTTRAWGWSGSTDRDYRPRYLWAVDVPGMDRPEWFGVLLERDTATARSFRSLSQVVRAARAVSCTGGMAVVCRDGELRASAAGDVVTFVLRDSARIARLFGMRPPFLWASEVRPEHAAGSRKSVRVDYVEPMIPEPDANTRADAARSRYRFEATVNSITRFVAAGASGEGPVIWLVVGDSVPVRVGELHCRHDACAELFRGSATDSGWSIADSSIARLQPVVRDTSVRRYDPSAYRARWHLKGLRPGRTTIRVWGIHGPSDSLPSTQPPGREVRRDVTVSHPIGEIELSSGSDTVRVNRPLAITAKVFDIHGQLVPEVPVTIEVERGYTYGARSSVLASLELRTVGRTRIVARTGVHTDTLVVTVVDSSSAIRTR